MELKVWVDGIQRIVCGATLGTTCHDVVLALAHAMGRTGRFTLLEIWRDAERPLAQVECPLQVLQKWGEYAGEVQFVLRQADSSKPPRPQEQATDCINKRHSNHTSLLPSRPAHVVCAHRTLTGVGWDTSLKRSLTFSGAHGVDSSCSSDTSSSSISSAKFCKKHLGPVPNGDVNSPVVSSRIKQPSPSPAQQGVSVTSSETLIHEQQPKVVGIMPVHTHGKNPVPQPRRLVSPAPQPRTNIPHNTAGTPSASLSSVQLSLNHDEKKGVNRVFPLEVSNSPIDKMIPGISLHPSHQPNSQVDQQVQRQQAQGHHTFKNQTELRQKKHENFRGHSTPPPLPTSIPPLGASTSGPHHYPHYNDIRSQELEAVEATLGNPEHSRQASLEIEEYDLEGNFPDSLRDRNRSESSVRLEYRLDEGIGSEVGGHMEGEHARLMRLVNMQQERMKIQESQISLVNTEISVLEERENEYEDQLECITSELLLLENRQREFEPELSDLEAVSWESSLDIEKKHELNLTKEISSYKVKIQEQGLKLQEARQKEMDLVAAIKIEEDNIREQERLKIQEEQIIAEVAKVKDELYSLQIQLSEMNNSVAEREATLNQLEMDLKAAESQFLERRTTLDKLEKQLKSENSDADALSSVNLRPKDSGETILQILEGRLSPRPVKMAAKQPDTSSGTPFISTLGSQNQSGVWV